MSASDNLIEVKKARNIIIILEIITLLNEGYKITLTLNGISMFPFLDDKHDKGLLIKQNNIKKGDVIAQVIFMKYFITDNDNAEGVRTGGFGSTDK